MDSDSILLRSTSNVIIALNLLHLLDTSIKVSNIVFLVYSSDVSEDFILMIRYSIFDNYL